MKPCLLGRLGTLEDATIGDQAQEGEQGRPGKSHRYGAGQTTVQPRAGSLVLGKLRDVSVDEEIGVDEDHRKPSPSASARASATLSRSPIRHLPKETAFVRNGSTGSARPH